MVPSTIWTYRHGSTLCVRGHRNLIRHLITTRLQSLSQILVSVAGLRQEPQYARLEIKELGAAESQIGLEL